MRTTIIAICGLLTFSIAALAQDKAVSLELVDLDSTAKSGEGIPVNLRTTNSSNHSFSYWLRGFCDYKFKVLTAYGSPAPETEMKKAAHCEDSELAGTSNRNIGIMLKPGEYKDDVLILTEFYDMSEPGEYSVQVERTYPGFGHAVSKVVKITITP